MIDELALALWRSEDDTYGCGNYELGGVHDDQAEHLRKSWLAQHDREVAAKAVRQSAQYARPDGGDHVGMSRTEAQVFEAALTLVDEYAFLIEKGDQ